MGLFNKKPKPAPKADTPPKTEMTTADRDKVWRDLSEKSHKHIQAGEYGLYRNCRFSMAEFLLKKEDKPNDALALLTEVCFWDLNGCRSPNELTMLLDNKIFRIAPYEQTSLVFAPGVIKLVGTCQKKLSYSDEQLRAAMRETLAMLTAPVQFFSVDEIADIIFWRRDGNTELLTKVFAKAKKRFDPRHPNAINAQN